jgi:hypothetical protein
MKLNINFKDIIKEYIINNKLFIKTTKSKYTLDDILKVLEYILVDGASWRSLELDIFENKYKWQSIYYHFNKWTRRIENSSDRKKLSKFNLLNFVPTKLNIFEKIYKELLTKYFKKNAKARQSRSLRARARTYQEN